MHIVRQMRKQNALMGVDFDRIFIHRKKKRDESYRMHAEHFHNYYELVFQFSHTPAVATVSGKEYRADGPTVWFRAPYVLHSIRTEGEYVRTMTAFQPQILREYGKVLDLGNLYGRQACMIPCTDADMERFDQILSRMQKIWRANGSEEAWICLLGVLLCEVSGMVTDEFAIPAEMPSYMQEILRYIAESPGEDMRTAALAKKFFVGRTKLTQDFLASLGVPPHEYITAIRIAQAKQWLLEGVSIDAVATRCGFAQESSFIYMFRREVGMTPGEWRRRNA